MKQIRIKNKKKGIHLSKAVTTRFLAIALFCILLSSSVVGLSLFFNTSSDEGYPSDWIKEGAMYTTRRLDVNLFCLHLLNVSDDLGLYESTSTLSMVPVITPTTTALVDKNISFDEIKKGDIVLFDAGDAGLVSHRVIDIVDEGLVTKGDNNSFDDREWYGLVATDDLIGVVIGVLY